jgi:hypothetical protein
VKWESTALYLISYDFTEKDAFEYGPLWSRLRDKLRGEYGISKSKTYVPVRQSDFEEFQTEMLLVKQPGKTKAGIKYPLWARLCNQCSRVTLWSKSSEKESFVRK